MNWAVYSLTSESCPSLTCHCRYLAAAPPQEADRLVSLDYAFGNGLSAEVWGPFQRRYNVDRVVEFYLSTEGNLGLFNCFDQASLH